MTTDVPAVPLKRVARVTTGEAPTSVDGGPIPIVGANGVIGATDRANVFAPAIVVGRVGSAGAVNDYPGPIWVTDNALVVEPIEQRLDFAFARHVIPTLGLSEGASQTAQPLITQTMVRERLMPLPPLHRQRAIAGFLDAEMSRIDDLVAHLRRRLELVERRLSAKTQDLFVAQEWARVPLKTVAKYREGPGVLSHDIRGSGVPLLRIVNLVNDSVSLDDLRYLDPGMVQSRWSHMRVREGDLIVSGSATSGLPVRVPPEAAGAVPWTGLIRIWPSSMALDAEFLRLFLGSTVFLEQVDQMRNGIAIQHWGPSHLAQVRIPLPPLSVQRAAAVGLARARDAERGLRMDANRQLDLLLERRQALITAAVTGQLEIPGVAA